MPKGTCLITGVGPATGLSLVKRFAAGGYKVAMTGRSDDRLAEFEKQVDGTKRYALDVTEDGALHAAVEQIGRDLGPIKVVIHNAGNAVFGDVLSVSAEDFEAAWRLNARALFMLTRETAPAMIASGGGAILVTGATASLRGGAGFSAFAPAKAAQRSLAQSMAKTLGPQGVHVAYVVVDGVIDTPVTRSFLTDRPDDKFLRPDDIAESYFMLAHQPRSAWTFELDLRPANESW
jgi:NAD(P)-dependent dehydrogenase (short-subunit alcohol dehydrogenase family)